MERDHLYAPIGGGGVIEVGCCDRGGRVEVALGATVAVGVGEGLALAPQVRPKAGPQVLTASSATAVHSAEGAVGGEVALTKAHKEHIGAVALIHNPVACVVVEVDHKRRHHHLHRLGEGAPLGARLGGRYVGRTAPHPLGGGQGGLKGRGGEQAGGGLGAPSAHALLTAHVRGAVPALLTHTRCAHLTRAPLKLKASASLKITGVERLKATPTWVADLYLLSVTCALHTAALVGRAQVGHARALTERREG